MKKLMTLTGVLIFTIGSFAQTQWKVDPYHSSINFNIEHSGISIVNGKFTEYSGSLVKDDDKLNGAKFDFTVNAASINTSVEPRDNHLKSPDFFDTEKFPEIKFKSTKILATGNPDHYLLYES
ncbi:YceI family protein [Marinigracilibium pacificum]|uniref:YceI family protein n=1 Tax=Marinigracilibium pacificum TaxID=2729599 RepID=UPI00232A540E|nr:YceI family protein [Marinigracilibium pacificum]